MDVCRVGALAFSRARTLVLCVCVCVCVCIVSSFPCAYACPCPMFCAAEAWVALVSQLEDLAQRLLRAADAEELAGLLAGYTEVTLPATLACLAPCFVEPLLCRCSFTCGCAGRDVVAFDLPTLGVSFFFSIFFLASFFPFNFPVRCCRGVRAGSVCGIRGTAAGSRAGGRAGGRA
jgi:hypothetical protein